MGYYTYYSLSYNIPDSCDPEIEEKINKRFVEILEPDMTEEDRARYYADKEGRFYNAIDIALQEEMKWYESDADMRQLSNEFPEVEFTLDGEGEESGDIWRAYYKGGKSQYTDAHVSFDPPEIFNATPSQLEHIDKFCRDLAAQWKRYPDYRFFQMMCNIFGDCGIDPFYINDSKAADYVQAHFDNLLDSKTNEYDR